MTKPNSTEIVFVVDRSGSMSSIAADMRGGFAALVDEQKKLPGECKVTLTQFDDHYDVVYQGRPIAEVPALDLRPRGSTALLDAIGRTIDDVGARLRAMAEGARPSKVLFVIITDGHENASKEYRRQRVFDMIKTQRESFSWDFVFMGASQDAIAVAGDLGIQAQNAVFYTAAAGAAAQGVMRGLSSNLASYRAGKGLGDMQASYNAASGQSNNLGVVGGTSDAIPLATPDDKGIHGS